MLLGMGLALKDVESGMEIVYFSNFVFWIRLMLVCFGLG